MYGSALPCGPWYGSVLPCALQADLGLSRVASRVPKRSKSCKCHSPVARVTRHSRRVDGLRYFLPSVEIVISAANERGLKRRRPENRASQLGFTKQRVVNVVKDTWLATAGLRGGQILEARFSTFAASHTPLSSASGVSQVFCTSRWTGQLRRKSLLCRAWRLGEVSFYLLQLSLKSFFLHSRAGVRLRNQRLQTLRRPCHLSLRHRSFRMVGT